MRKVVLLLVSLTLGACGALQGPGPSMEDPDYFAERPRLVKTGGGYDLVWRYGELGFYFVPDCRVGSAALICTLRATSSSGSLSGRAGKLEITDSATADAIDSHGAYWLEPDGEKVRIEIAGPGRTGL